MTERKSHRDEANHGEARRDDASGSVSSEEESRRSPQQANPGKANARTVGYGEGRERPNPGVRNADGSVEQADLDDSEVPGNRHADSRRQHDDTGREQPGSD